MVGFGFSFSPGNGRRHGGGGGGDTIAPTITSSAIPSVAENATLGHALTANEAVTWSIVGGADQAKFEISGSTLRWLANGTKDYEAPDDAGTNNGYVVTVRATDGASNTTDQTITVTVTDVDDDPIVETDPGYSESFTYSDGEVLTGATLNWTSISANGATAAADAAIVQSGRTGYTSGPADYDSHGSAYASGSNLLAPPYDPGTQDMWVQWKIASMDAGNHPVIDILANSEVDKLELRFTNGSGAAVQYNGNGADPTNPGGASSLSTGRFAGFGGSGSHQKLPAEGDVFTAQVYSGLLYLYRNGAPFTDPAGIDVSALTGTNFGLATWNVGYYGVDDFKAGALAGNLKIDNPLAAYPRIQGLGGYENGAADVTFTGSYEGTVTGLQWALKDPETGAVLKDWARAASPTIGGGDWEATVRVPCGLNDDKPYRIAFRAENDSWAFVESQTLFSVCYTVLLTGQSNAKFLSGANTVTGIPDHPGGFAYVPADPPSTTDNGRNVITGWQSSTDESNGEDNNLGMLTLGMSGALGLPIYIMDLGIGSRNALNCGPLGSEAAYLATHLAQAGGAFDAMVIYQGEDEISTGNYTAEWQPQWIDNIDYWRSVSGQPEDTVIPAFVGITGKYDTVAADEPLSNAAGNIVRAAQVDLPNQVDDCTLAFHAAGVTMADGFHYTVTNATGYYEMNRRIALSMAKVLGGGDYDGRGPIATGATRSGATVTVAVDLNGADSIAGTALTSWVASVNSDMSSPLTISSVGVSGGDVIIVLSANPGVPVYVANYRGYNPDVSSWVVGTYADATTIEMEPIVVPILTTT